jgi:hypothetical protein
MAHRGAHAANFVRSDAGTDTAAADNQARSASPPEQSATARAESG